MPQFHLINSDQGSYALQVGCNFGITPISNGLELFTPNIDFTGWTFKAQVRENYQTEESISMADFAFTSPATVSKTINGVSVTGSHVFMTMEATEAVNLLIPPKLFPTITNQTKQLQSMLDTGIVKVGIHCWLYEVKAVSPTGVSGGVCSVIQPSLVQVIDLVTQTP